MPIHPDKLMALETLISLFFIILALFNILVWTIPRSISTWILRAIITGPTIYILYKMIAFFVKYT